MLLVSNKRLTFSPMNRYFPNPNQLFCLNLTKQQLETEFTKVK